MYLHDRDIDVAFFYDLLLDFRTDRTVWYIFVLYYIQKMIMSSRTRFFFKCFTDLFCEYTKVVEYCV